MHERNPYNMNPPDFAALGRNHPFLMPYITLARNGRGHIDFKNNSALRALTRALLLDDFKLDVTFPETSLVPTVPLRLNYVLWIEDLFNQTNEPLRGLDIGTGCSAIYILLCARLNKWRMIGTDIKPESIRFARRNVVKNGLEDLVEVRQVEGNSIFGTIFESVTTKFNFTMCNPPFFSSDAEADSTTKARRPNRPPPSAAKSGSSSELVSEGGEEQFISKMILESKEYGDRVNIFTTMVGVKRHLKALLKQLKLVGVQGSSVTEFVQGKTMRWGLAWTFQSCYATNLTTFTKLSVPMDAKFKCDCSLAEFVSFVKSCLGRLEFKSIVDTEDRVEVIVETNTWSHQRRKRRELERLKDNEVSSLETDSLCKVSRIMPQKPELTPEKNVPTYTTPANSEFITASYDLKEEVLQCINGGSDPSNSEKASYEEKECALHFGARFQYVDLDFVLSLEFKGGHLGRNGLGQVLQYLKNAIAKKYHT